MSDDDLIRRGDAIAAAANLYKWSIAAGEELEAAIRAIPAADARAEALREAAAVAAKFDSDGMYGAAAIHDAILALIPETKP